MSYKLADGSDSADYSKGDRFTVVEKGAWFNVGDEIVLSKNDGSSCPYFTRVGGVYRYPMSFSGIKRSNQFTKSDLKDGMRVELRDGDIHYICGDVALTANSFIIVLANYQPDLSSKYDKMLDIMKVTDRDGTVLFEREEPKKKVTLKLTDQQIESLKQQGVL